MAAPAVRAVAVIGAGVMGRGIALASSLAGFETRVVEPSEKAIGSAQAELEKILTRAQEKGELDAATASAAKGRLTWAPGPESVKGSDLVIEAAPESVPLKAEIYRKLTPHLPA